MCLSLSPVFGGELTSPILRLEEEGTRTIVISPFLATLLITVVRYAQQSTFPHRLMSIVLAGRPAMPFEPYTDK
jgi:hypothetical protein